MTASDPSLPLLPTSTAHDQHAFPTLTAAQIQRIAAHGRRRAVARDEVLVESGAKVVPFFVVVAGELEIVRPSGA